MAASDLATLKAIAEMLGVGEKRLSRTRTYLSGFPVGETVGGRTFYSKKAVRKWARGKDVSTLVREAMAAVKRGDVSKQVGAATLISLSKRMAAGEFACPQQKQQYAMKKLVSRNCRQAPRRRITVASAW